MRGGSIKSPRAIFGDVVAAPKPWGFGNGAAVLPSTSQLNIFDFFTHLSCKALSIFAIMYPQEAIQEKTKEELNMFAILFTGVSSIINLALLKGFAKAILHILF